MIIRIFLLLVFILLNACGGLSDAGKVLRNEKVKTTDEFLVKKRKPLVLPPEFNEVPEPGSISKNKKSDKEDIKNILKVPTDISNSENKSSSIEQSIINKIRK